MTCEECHETFIPMSIKAVFCSGACKQRAYRRRKKVVTIAVRVAGGPRRANVARIQREVNDRVRRRGGGKVVTGRELRERRATRAK